MSNTTNKKTNIENTKQDTQKEGANTKNKNIEKSKTGTKGKSVKKKKTSNSTKIMIAFVVSALIFCICGCIYILKTDKTGKPVKGDVPETQTTTEPPIIKEFVGLENIELVANISKYYTYGTSLCIEGNVTETQLQDMKLADIEKVSFILKKAYTNPDGSINSDTLYAYTADTEIVEDTLKFRSYTRINDGICLENIANEEYVMLLEITDNAGQVKTCSFTSINNLEALTYYTITKNGTNQKINMSLTKNNDKDYMTFNVCEATLPEDVYDIVLDPGHGGNDPGAVNGENNEAVLMLDYANAIKKALEDEGYKVALTRDGTEPDTEKMAYTMYDDNGRVNKACRTNAKMCFSLHLNSNEAKLSKGGIQVYYTCRGNEKLAKNMVDNIVDLADTYASTMTAYKVIDGVYRRSFSQGDVDEAIKGAKKGGYEPYPVTTDTDFYFMIRELGGVATNAYVDGRNPIYGCNNYRNSINGVETCIMELAFISVEEDLNHILTNKEGYVRGIVNGVNVWVKGVEE